MNDIKFSWYGAYCMPGREERAKRLLEQRITSMGMEDLFRTVFIPRREVNKWSSGKRSKVEECIYPGYIFIEMVMSPESFFAVKGTPSIAGFANNNSLQGHRNDPSPITQAEMNVILGVGEKKVVKPTNIFNNGDSVKIAAGPFAEMIGSVFLADDQKQRLKVTLSFFGRETVVELNYSEVTKQ
jgi:transcriptional antiterminator NusG